MKIHIAGKNLTKLHYHIKKHFTANYELDPADFVSAPGLAWQACLKNAGVNLELLTDIDMLLMIENELEVECVKQFIDMLKQTIYI